MEEMEWVLIITLQIIEGWMCKGMIPFNQSYLAAYTVDSCYNMVRYNIDVLVQDCNNSSALAMELLQSCTKPSTWCLQHAKD